MKQRREVVGPESLVGSPRSVLWVIVMPAEAKVGLLVIFVGLLVAAIAIYLAGYMGRIATYEVTAQFTDAQGLRREGKVQLAGVRIGTVIDVGLRDHKDFRGKHVSVAMAIRRDTPLYETDSFNIKQHGLLGDEYVAVTRSFKKKRGKKGGDYAFGPG